MHSLHIQSLLNGTSNSTLSCAFTLIIDLESSPVLSLREEPTSPTQYNDEERFIKGKVKAVIKYRARVNGSCNNHFYRPRC